MGGIEINEGLDALQRAELVPDGTYDCRIVDIRYENQPDNYDADVYGPWVPSWGRASAELIHAHEELNNVADVIGRRVDYWLFNKYGKRGVLALLTHKCQFDPEGGWDQGIPMDAEGRRTTDNLREVEFTAKISSAAATDGTGYKQSVRPLIKY